MSRAAAALAGIAVIGSMGASTAALAIDRNSEQPHAQVHGDSMPAPVETLPWFELTSFATLRLGGDFALDDPAEEVDLDDAGAFAFAINLRADETSQYELFYGRQQTRFERGSSLAGQDIDVEYLHVGGTAALIGEHRLIPYMVGGLGVTRFSPAVNEEDATRFSLSLGGGVRVPVSPRFSLRFEGRGYLTFIDTDTAFFCRSDEGGALCRVRGSGSTFLQYELLAGAAFSF
jgi:opacity protein-like surface antigen